MYQNTYKPPFTPSTSFASTSTFGQPATNQNMFPSMQPTNIFQSPSTSSFTAGPPAQTQFGSNLFGQPAQPASGGLFGASNAFGQTKSFGFGATPSQTSLFGQPQQQPSTTNLFQSNSANLFGSTNAFASPAQSGTVVKFSPVSGTDTMQKNGVAQTISTKHHCITCMKEYETKSLEELRFEDYSVNRKGPQQSTFTQAPFGAGVANTVGTPGSNLFGQTENKQAFGQTAGFGQTTAGFGQTASTGFGINTNQTSTPTLFGGKQIMFGTPTTNANTFGTFNTTGTQVSNPFGGNQPTQKSFTQTNFFGTPAAVQTSQTSFGNTSVFGQPATQTAAVFPSSSQTGFSFNQPTATQSAPNLFQSSKASAGFGIFGQPSNTPTTGFGQQTAAPAFVSNFGQKTSTTSFGQGVQTGFGATLGGGLQPQQQQQQQQQQPSLFNTSAKAPPLFSNTGSQAGLFMGNTYQPATNSMFSMPNFSQQAPASFAVEDSESKNIQFVATDISPDGRQYRGLDPVLPNSLANATATNPAELQAILESAKKRDDVDNSRFKSKMQQPKLHKVAGVEGGTLPNRLYFSQSPNLQREFFDSAKAISSSPRCLVLRKESGTAAPVLGKYKNELLEEAEMAMRSNKGLLMDDNVRPTGTDTSYEEYRGEEPPLMAMKLNFDTSSLGSATDLLEERRLPAKNNSKNRSIAVDLDFDADGNSICEEPGDFQPLRTSSLFTLKDYIPEIEETTDNDTPSVVSLETQHPYGVVLTRPEYYMFPDKKDLHQYADGNGRVVVPGLTLGRKGYGNVYFSDHIDITNMNFDELIHFRHREVTVYPDDSVKPAVGEGLNRPSQVTLDKIYPREKNSQVYVTDIDEITKTNFVDKLIAITQKHKCKFIDYRPKTGSWVFKVNHFSKYGLTDSDEDECSVQKDEALEMAKKLIQPVKKPEETQSTQTAGLGGDDESVQVGGSSETAKTGSVVVEMHAVEEDGYWEDHSFSFRSARVQDKGAIKTSLFGEAETPVIFKPSVLTSKQVGISAVHAQPRNTMEVDEEVPRLEPSTVRVEPTVYELPRLRRQCLPGKTDMWQVKTYTELALFRSDAFKPGWGKGCRFFHFDPSCDINNVSYNVNNCSLNVTGPSSYDSMMPNLNDALKIAVESSTLEVDGCGVPTLSIKTDPSFLEAQTRLFHSQIRSRCLPGKQRYLAHLWTLCSALWLGDNLTEYDRKANLSEWLKVTTNDLCKLSKTNQSPMEQVFDHLTFHRVYDACDVAMRNKMPRTSILISQNIDTGKDLLNNYLDSSEWFENMVPEEMKKIYLLLAGVPVKDGVNICNGIDWKRSMGLYLWYIAPYDSSIYEVTRLFRESFQGGYSAAPLPPHAADQFDLYWHVISLYCNDRHMLRKVLNPVTHTPNQSDYRLSWLLFQLFKSLQIGSVDDNEERYLHTTFANQLEQIGLWKWSIVALLYLKNNILKKNLIMKVLERNLSHETNEMETDLVLDYKLPAEWIHEVKAYQSKYLDNHYDSFQHFVHMGNHFEACNVFSNALMPELFINERYSELKRFLIILEPYSRILLNWNVHAGLVYDYLKLHEVFLQEDERRYQLLQFDFDKVIDRLIYFPMKNATQNVMLTELCRRCALMFKVIFKDLAPQLFLGKFNDMFKNLVMPPDYKQFELEYMAYLQFGCSAS